MVQISYVRQKEQLGLGHAVLMAKELDRPRAVRGDAARRRVVGDRPCIGQLIDAYNRTHGSVVAVMEVPDSEVSRYGVIDPDSDARDERRAAAQGPAPGREAGGGFRAEQPGDHRPLCPDAQDLRKLESDPARCGRRDPADRRDLVAHLREQDVYAYAFEGKRYDAGTTMGWLQGFGRAGAGTTRHWRGVPTFPVRARPELNLRGLATDLKGHD